MALASWVDQIASDLNQPFVLLFSVLRPRRSAARSAALATIAEAQLSTASA
jgi:hypothetical protein